jgi:RNA polymerase sigma-70 factor (ECF subfamily)
MWTMPRAGDAEFNSFPATQWTLVGRAALDSPEERRQALGVLLQRYLPALRAYLVFTKRIPQDRAEDLLQGFASDKLVEQNLIAAADRERGKFRSFLLVALNRYVIDQIRREKAAKRSGGQAALNIDDQLDLADAGGTPAEQFNLAWAQEMIAEAMRRMQEHCEQSKRRDIWVVFEGRILKPALNGEEPVSYEELTSALGLEAVLTACNLLTSAKRIFARYLRSVAAEYAGDEQEVDGEIAALRQALGTAPSGGGAE